MGDMLDLAHGAPGTQQTVGTPTQPALVSCTGGWPPYEKQPQQRDNLSGGYHENRIIRAITERLTRLLG